MIIDNTKNMNYVLPILTLENGTQINIELLLGNNNNSNTTHADTV